jgi:hypothetical protein
MQLFGVPGGYALLDHGTAANVHLRDTHCNFISASIAIKPFTPCGVIPCGTPSDPRHPEILVSE